MNVQTPTRARGRPPKVHPGLGETRDALIRAGVIALTEKGFAGAALEDILEAAGVPKGSFYHYFPSKESFGLELIDSYALYFAHRLDSFLLNASFTPLDRLRAFTLNAQATMERYGYTRGCLIGNLSQETDLLSEAFRSRLIQVLQDWQQRTGNCLRAAQAAGTLGAAHDCDRLSAFFWIGWEGAVSRAKLERRGEPLSVFATHFFALLGR